MNNEQKINTNELTIKEMKKIVHEIIEEEAKNYNLDINAFPLTIVEYYKNQFRNKQFILIDTAPFSAGVYRSSTKEIFIYLNNIKNRSLELGSYNETIFQLAKTSYHEVRHQLQHEFDIYSYEGFLMGIESYIRKSSSDVDYIRNYTKYLAEIDANLYGVSRAKKYLKNKYPEQYETQKDQIEKLEKKYNYDYLTYDAVDTVERFIKVYNNDKKEKKERIKVYLEDLEVSPAPVINMFINEDNSFKKITEIINNENFKNLDLKIVHAFFSCKSFLESLDIDSLSLEELEFLNTSLQYTNTSYRNQTKLTDTLLNDKFISLKEYLQDQKDLTTKIFNIEKFRTTTKEIIKLLRIDKKKKEHIENIPNYLEKTNKLIKKRNNKGYLTINIFYIIGIILSLLTIIYLITINI